MPDVTYLLLLLSMIIGVTGLAISLCLGLHIVTRMTRGWLTRFAALTLGSTACLCLYTALVACTSPTPTAAVPSPATVRSRSIDGMTMVLVPAGPFLMGSAETDPKAADDEVPQHAVTLDAFWIDRTEVTNAQYAVFLNTLGGYRAACDGQDCAETQREDKYSRLILRDGQIAVEGGFEEHPVTQVSWYGARSYCAWAGARLPTEAEWEKAARGTDGRLYPWGDGEPGCEQAAFGTCSHGTVATGSLPAGASPYGALDMAGNVWEWVHDRYDAGTYRLSPAQDPQGPDAGWDRVFRGGSWGTLAVFLRTTDRGNNSPTYAGFNIGFRCASDAGPE